MDKMNTGIYCIEHLASGKKYVGSAVSMRHRWRVHLCSLRKNRHHSRYLQAAWNKYGEGAFEFKKLLVCSKENLLMYEQLCIDGYAVCNPEKGYNTLPIAGSPLGYKTSDATKAKLSIAGRGRTQSAESRALKSLSQIGLPRPAKSAAHLLLRQTSKAYILTIEKAREMRALVAAGSSRKQVAAAYGVTYVYGCEVIRGVKWREME